ncbi:GNAT family N-acetyltransferase [Salinibacillus xinjiangensis]|nr:N-acetyltransferase [Salinibacillus xinjiangensis]
MMKFYAFDQHDPDLEQIGELYCRTFIGENYSLKDMENALKNVKKHASYKGFKCLKAKSQTGNLVGFTYGYTSLPGQFYRGKIASQLPGRMTTEWLSDCFEFVELAVNSSYRRLGIASQLHDKLLEDINHNTSVLTTSENNYPAIHFYQKKGWQIIKNHAAVLSKDDPQVIMGKHLVKSKA